MANRIMLNETSYHGAGAIAEIVTEAKARGFSKALICSDPDLIKFGVTAKVTDLLDKAGLAYAVYSGIKANPTIENVKDGVKAFQDAGADYIIAIGGGSSMDTAKAIGIIINNPEFADVRSLEGVAPTKNPCLPIIAVPTTAGTAAEVTINEYMVGCYGTTEYTEDMSSLTLKVEAGENSAEIAYEYKCREASAPGAEEVWCKLPPIQTLVSLTCRGRDKAGYVKEGYAFSPMFTLGYTGTLREKEVFTTWLNLKKAN